MLGELDETTMRSVRRLQHEHDVDVSSLMAETFEARKDWIQHHSPPVRTVLALFPPLKDIFSSHMSTHLERLVHIFA